MSFPSKDADNETNTRQHAVADSSGKKEILLPDFLFCEFLFAK